MTIFTHYALDKEVDVEIYENEGKEFIAIDGKERELKEKDGKIFAERSSWFFVRE